jgi:hypothetical protein
MKSTAPTYGREKLREIMIENAAEINRLTRRIHETVKHRSESDDLRQEWSQACEEFHARYGELCIPGGSTPDFYERILAGDQGAIEVALCFLEVRPYFFRSGYHWKAILQKCKRAPVSGEQAERLARLVDEYSEWRRLRRESSIRGAAVRQNLWPLLQRFDAVFAVRIPDHRLDGMATVGDLYGVLCGALKIQPAVGPQLRNGSAKYPRRPGAPRGDKMEWAREYMAWRQYPWTPEDVWATLVAKMRDAYKLDHSIAVVPETLLCVPDPVDNSSEASEI